MAKQKALISFENKKKLFPYRCWTYVNRRSDAYTVLWNVIAVIVVFKLNCRVTENNFTCDRLKIELAKLIAWYNIALNSVVSYLSMFIWHGQSHARNSIHSILSFERMNHLCSNNAVWITNISLSIAQDCLVYFRGLINYDWWF